jgi:acid phosphatase type 7
MSAGRIFLVIVALLISTVRLSAQNSEKPIGILLAVGDIASCHRDPTRSGAATAELIKREIASAKAIDQNLEVRVLALGDLAYDHGSPQSFRCFDATWGAFKDKILPVPGNHDYETSKGAAYFKYFETTLRNVKAAKGKAYFSLEFPPPADPDDNRSWLLIGLDSNVETGANSEQVRWLKAELSRTKRRCVLAFSHAFFYSSGRHGHHENSTVTLTKPLVPEKAAHAFFNTLYAGRASVFVAGHDHHYEQLGRANAEGKAADNGMAAMVPDGVRSFVVGTGGKALYSDDYQKKWAFTEAYDLRSHGVLKIELYPDSYRWAFLPTKPNDASFKVVRDVRTDRCNRP